MVTTHRSMQKEGWHVQTSGRRGTQVPERVSKLHPYTAKPLDRRPEPLTTRQADLVATNFLAPVYSLRAPCRMPWNLCRLAACWLHTGGTAPASTPPSLVHSQRLVVGWLQQCGLLRQRSSTVSRHASHPGCVHQTQLSGGHNLCAKYAWEHVQLRTP